MPSLLATGMSFQKVIVPLLVLLWGTWNIVYSVARLDGSESPHQHRSANADQPADHREMARPFLRPPPPAMTTTTTRSVAAARPPFAYKKPQRVWNQHHQPGKPFLVIHVGPIHTLAPELHLQLTQHLSSELHADGFVVADEHTTAALTSYECHKQLHETRKKFQKEGDKDKKGDVQQQHQRDDISSSLAIYLSSNCDCWGHVLDLLAGHRERGESLIVIDDSLAGRTFHFDGLSMSTMDVIAMEETLSSDWNVEIVVGYRRFAEWLPLAVETNSKRRHREERDLQRDHTMVIHDDHPIAPALFPDIISSVENGILLGVDAPHTREMVDRITFRSSPDHGPAKIPVTVLNVHDDDDEQGPLAKAFACHVLWHASKTCTAAARLPPPTLLKRQDPVQLEDFYDFLAGEAYKHSAYRIHDFTTQVAAIAIRHYQEDVFGLPATDLPMDCPSRPAMQRLLQLSLSREREISPHFAAARRDEHMRTFWETFANHAPQRLCTVSWKLLMRDGRWRMYLRELPHGVPKELLPHDVTHHNNEAPKAMIHNGVYKGRIIVKRVQHNQH